LVPWPVVDYLAEQLQIGDASVVKKYAVRPQNRPAPALVLRPGDREELERWTRASTVPAAATRRARIVLLAAEGVANTRIAELVDATYLVPARK
jgi:hypothetical protein